MINRSPAGRDLPSPLVPPLEDNAQLVRMLAELLGKSEADARRILYEDELSLGKYHRQDFANWGLTPHVWSERLAEYYRKTDSGPTGQPAWNRRPEKLKIREWIGRYLRDAERDGLDILMVGDGAGFDSAYLAQCGHRVTYSEESRINIEFARKVFALNALDVRIVDDGSALHNSTYDAVVCLDVLEHVHEPAQLTAAIAKFRRPGGVLIVHAPFFFVDEWNPTHLAENIRYSGSLRKLYGVHGLHLVDGCSWWNPIVLAKPAADGSLPPRSLLRLSVLYLRGLLLSTARIWRAPHNWVAKRAMQTGEAKWLRGLETTE